MGSFGGLWVPFGALCTSHLPPVEAYINKKLIFSNPPRLPTESSLREHAAGATGATGATGAAEVVSRTVARTPPSTHAGGQDDGSYTNSLKLHPACVRAAFLPVGSIKYSPITLLNTVRPPRAVLSQGSFKIHPRAASRQILCQRLAGPKLFASWGRRQNWNFGF